MIIISANLDQWSKAIHWSVVFGETVVIGVVVSAGKVSGIRANAVSVLVFPVIAPLPTMLPTLTRRHVRSLAGVSSSPVVGASVGVSTVATTKSWLSFSS